jgi:hypothetical protein
MDEKPQKKLKTYGTKHIMKVYLSFEGEVYLQDFFRN